MSGRESLQHGVIEKEKKKSLMAQDGDNKRRGRWALATSTSRAAGERGKQGQRVLKALFSAVEKRKREEERSGVEAKKEGAIG